MRTFRKLAPCAALAALLVASPGVLAAQDAGPAPAGEPAEQTPPVGAGAEMPEPVAEGAVPAEGQAPPLAEEAAPDVQVAEEPEAPVEPVEGSITLQDENTILASDLIGARVYNAAEETVGDINDAIMSLDGNVEGVVIGVGGFLGMGEKRVAVELSQLTVATDEDGTPRLVIDATRESLEAAPEFVTAAALRAEEQSQEPQATQPLGGTAPAGGAPATN